MRMRNALISAVCGALAVLLAATWPTSGVAAARIEDSFFSEKLYPVLDQAQCRLCHGEKGVASTTRLEFPREDAPATQITAFGLGLAKFIDAGNPQNSLLFRKPTNRDQHTGGERIKQGSDEEKLLLSWIGRLAELSIEERSAALASSLTHKAGAVDGVMRRLTHSQYNNTVRDLLGVPRRKARRPGSNSRARTRRPPRSRRSVSASRSSSMPGTHRTHCSSANPPTAISTPAANESNKAATRKSSCCRGSAGSPSFPSRNAAPRWPLR